MSSTQRLQDYIDSLKAARLGGNNIQNDTLNNNNNTSQGNDTTSFSSNNNNNSSPYRQEPKDMLELEFMDSLDARMQQMERNLSSANHNNSRNNNNNNTSGFNSIVSPAPNNYYSQAEQNNNSNNSLQGSTLLQKLMNQNQNQNSSLSLLQQQQSARRNYMWNNNSSNQNSTLKNGNSSLLASNTFASSASSLVFRVTLPFLRSTIGTSNSSSSSPATASSVNSECATFLVHVADLSQTGDDLLWHVIAQARIRFPDLMQVGGFEWTPGAASSLVLFALAQEEASYWVDSDQSKGGSARSGGAFLHYDSATPLFRYAPINKALRKREQEHQKQQQSNINGGKISEAMARNIRELGPSVDVELFVLMKTMVPSYELTSENMRRQLVV